MTAQKIIASHMASFAVDRPGSDEWIHWMKEAVDVIDDLRAAGLVIVPKEPTPEMCDPVWQHLGYGADYDEVYRAMVAAAPAA